MELNLTDKFLLLALDDDKGTFISEPFAVTYGLAGTILLELSLLERIGIENKKVVLKSSKKVDDSFLNTYLEFIKKSKKNSSLKHWVQIFGNKERAIKKEVLGKLILKGILTKREEKFLWVFNNDKFPTVNSKPENTLRKRLYEIIEHGKTPTTEELMLISLINTCNMNRAVYGKNRVKNSKESINILIEKGGNSKEISATIKEVQSMIHAMIVTIITTSTMATTISNN